MEEAQAASRGPNITNCDRLRFVEVILSDKVKALYSMSQDCLTRIELENRNSVVRLCDFYDKAAEEFNNAEFLPESKCLPDLHEHFSESLELPLGNYIMTRDKVKDIMVTIGSNLAGMIAKYEVSGAGSGQNNTEEDGYGHVDLEEMI